MLLRFGVARVAVLYAFAAAAHAAPPAAPVASDAARVCAASARAVVEHERLGYDLTYVVRTSLASDLPAWRAAAGNGDRAGKWLLGLCNYYGIGGPRNAARGRELIRAAAEAGDAEAMGVLSQVLRAGDLDTPPDPDHANEWLGRALAAHGRIAADVLPIIGADELLAKGDVAAAMEAYARESKAGNANASVALAGVLRRGWLTRLDIDGSIRLLTEAAKAGHVGAMIELAHTYGDGRVVTPSQPAVARKWYDAGAATGDARALYEAQVAYASGRIGGHGPDPRDADATRATALRDQLRANGDPYSSFALYMIERTRPVAPTSTAVTLPAGVKTDERLAHDTLFDAATRGVPEAFMFLSIYQRAGSWGFEKDLKRSEAVLRQGVTAGDPNALFMMACARRFGWYGRADEDAAVPMFFAAARLGVPEAMSSVALRLHTGRGGVKADPQLGHFAYFAAAMAGDPDGMTSVAEDYLIGRGVARDAARAETWAWLAVRDGSPKGYDELYRIYGGTSFGQTLDERARQALVAGTAGGSRYCAQQLSMRLLRGDGLPADPKRGLAILDAAAAGDDFGDTQMILGDVYRGGIGGVAREPWRALAYYRYAAERGNGDAWASLADMYRTGLGVAADPAEAVRCLERGMALGSTSAFERMGSYYVEGWCVAADVPRGLGLWRTAAERGSGRSAMMLGRRMLFPEASDGPGVKPDVDEALKWLDRALALGEASAGDAAAIHFRELKDYASERVWLERGDKLGNGDCANGLGVQYRFGYGVPQDLAKAAGCYRRAAARGSMHGMINLAWCYETGSGLEKDPAAAFRTTCEVVKVAEARGPKDADAHQAYLNALIAVGRMHIDAVGTPRDVQAGLASIGRAADAGSEPAKAMIAAARAKGLMR